MNLGQPHQQADLIRIIGALGPMMILLLRLIMKVTAQTVLVPLPGIFYSPLKVR